MNTMEGAKKIERQERETLEIVLKEILEEQQRTSKINADQVTTIGELTIMVSSFNERLENLKIIPPPVSTKPLDEIIKKVISDIQLTVNNQPKIINRKFQILLFPERDAKLFYKIVFGRWLLWLTIIVFSNNLYKWSIHWNDNQKVMKQQQLETNRIKKSWNYLYFQKGKTIRKIMDSAYNKSKEQ